MKIKIYLFSIGMLLIILSACQEDLLDKSPLDTVTSVHFFNAKDDFEIYMNGFYARNVILGPTLTWRRGIYSSEVNSDNQINTVFEGIDLRLNGSITHPPSSGGGWDYSEVRKINFFFDNYRKCKDDFEEYKHYVGEAHFFRAVIYFRLLQKFGDVVWLDKVLNVDSEELYNSRTPRNIIADNIIADLDTAALYLNEEIGSEGPRMNRWYALAFQSRVALYEGTWEKYHAGTPFGVSNANPEKYFTKAVEAAEEVMESGLFKLYSTGNPERDYHDLFGLTNYSNSKEVLFWKKNKKDLGVSASYNYFGLYPENEGLTKRLVDSYLCIDGQPISFSPLFAGYDTIINEFKNRDPRLAQSVWGPEAPWKIDGTDTIYWGDRIWPNLNSTSKFSSPTGYANRKGTNPLVETQENTGEDGGVIFFRYAEVLLNFAEAKGELGTLSQSDIDRTIRLSRERVGMPNLEIGSISNDPDWDFPDLSPVINEIRRERRIELVSEGIRWDDVARWAAADELIAGKRPKGIKVGNQIPKNTFPVDDEDFLDPYADAIGSDGYGFDVNRHYLDPIPTNEIVLNSNLEQNPGW